MKTVEKKNKEKKKWKKKAKERKNNCTFFRS